MKQEQLNVWKSAAQKSDGLVRIYAEDLLAIIALAERALLAAAPAPIQKEPAFNMLAHLQRQRDFSEKTFGPGLRTKGVCDHIRKELAEIESDPCDLMEWIDVVILALDGAWRCGGTPQQIIDGIVAKQTKNEGRVWPDWRTADPNKAIEHDRLHDATPPALAGSQVQAAGDAPMSSEDWIRELYGDGEAGAGED